MINEVWESGNGAWHGATPDLHVRNRNGGHECIFCANMARIHLLIPKRMTHLKRI